MIKASCTITTPTTVFNGRARVSDCLSEHGTSLQDMLQKVRELMTHCLAKVRRGPAQQGSEYQINSGGTLLRARLALISGAAFNRSTDYQIASAAACELVHNASLVHDDLCDRDEIRRNRPTVWKLFGEGVALCSGDLLLCAAFNAACQIKNAADSRKFSLLLSELTSDVIVGQSLEVAPIVEGVSPRFRQYLEATHAKTVPLIELPLAAGAIIDFDAPHVRHAIRRLAESIGLAYQILDDLDDLAQNQSTLHVYHAWHHHRRPGRDSRTLRIQRAASHALAALQRARQRLAILNTMTPHTLDDQLTTLINRLQIKAVEYRHVNDYKESKPHGNFRLSN
jgi:geranylgeranyl diphosphate synthase, type II